MVTLPSLIAAASTSFQLDADIPGCAPAEVLTVGAVVGPAAAPAVGFGAGAAVDAGGTVGAGTGALHAARTELIEPMPTSRMKARRPTQTDISGSPRTANFAFVV